MQFPLQLRVVSAFVALGALACGGQAPSPGPEPAEARAPSEPIRPLLTSPFAGQQIAVVPITLLLAPDSLSRSAGLGDRAVALRWADSMVGSALETRAPEVKWALPPELRKMARRAPGIAPDPDRMGQAILRAPKLMNVPDPLRSHLRSLLALMGGRYALVPAALNFEPLTSGAVRAELAIALADTRTGTILWRTLAWGEGPTPERALSATLATVLPTELDLQ